MVSLSVLKEYYFENAKLPIFTFFFRHLTINSIMRSGQTWPHLKKWKNKHLVFILMWSSRHVNYLEKAAVSHHHLLPPLLLVDQPQRRPLAPFARTIVSVSVTIQRQLPQLSMDVPLPLLHQTTGKLVKTVINIKRYIERHVNYLWVVSQHP